MDMIVFPYIVHLQRTPRFFLIQLHPVTFPVTYPKCYLHDRLIANLFCIVATLDSKLPNGFCPVPRYTRTLPCEQMIARYRYTLSEYLQRAGGPAINLRIHAAKIL